jgi:hypothetical protein
LLYTQLDFSAAALSIVAQTVTEVIGIKLENNAFSNGVTTHFLTSGFIGVLEWWINNSNLHMRCVSSGANRASAKGIPDLYDIFFLFSKHVETVCLLSRKG